MRKKLTLVLVTLMLLIPTPVLAAGGMNHGDVGQGAANCVSQPVELPAHNGPRLP